MIVCDRCGSAKRVRTVRLRASAEHSWPDSEVFKDLCRSYWRAVQDATEGLGTGPARPRMEVAMPTIDPGPRGFLARLREMNVDRCEKSFGHGVDGWNVLEWAGAVCGEAGELANLCKKVRRGDSIMAAEQKVADEIADCVIYLDLLAAKLDIDLEAAIASKFNRVSIRVRYPALLERD